MSNLGSGHTWEDLRDHLGRFFFNNFFVTMITQLVFWMYA